MSDDDGGFTDFLNFKRKDGEQVSGVVKPANPVNWGGLGKAIGTSGIASLVLGITSIGNSVSDAIVGLLDGGREWLVGRTVDVSEASTGFSRAAAREVEGLTVNSDGTAEVAGLFDVVGILEQTVSSVFLFNAENLGVFAAPATVAITLAALYVVSVGLRQAAARLVGDA